MTQSMANQSAKTVLTDTQQSVTAVRKSSGTMTYTAMKAHASATAALKTTTLAARNATA